MESSQIRIEPCLLLWKVGSLSLSHQGSLPRHFLCFHFAILILWLLCSSLPHYGLRQLPCTHILNPYSRQEENKEKDYQWWVYSFLKKVNSQKHPQQVSTYITWPLWTQGLKGNNKLPAPPQIWRVVAASSHTLGVAHKLFYYFIFDPEAYGILVSLPRTELTPLALEVWSLNQWTAMEISFAFSLMGLPGGTMVKNPLPTQETHARDTGLLSGLGMSSGEGNGNTPVFSPGDSHRQRSLVGYRPWGGKESETAERSQLSGSILVNRGGQGRRPGSGSASPRDLRQLLTVLINAGRVQASLGNERRWWVSYWKIWCEQRSLWESRRA